MNQRPTSPYRTFYFLVAYCLPMAILDLLLAVLSAVNPNVIWLSDIGSGWTIGQFLIVLPLVAFLSRTWIVGWLVFSLLLYLASAIYQFFAPTETRYSQLEYLVQFTEIQFGLLACFVPLAALRTLRGWTWGHADKPVGVLQSIKVEDWFLFSFILCCSLALTGIAQARTDQASTATALNGFGSVLLGTTLVLVPLYAISFTDQTKVKLFLKWSGTAAVLLGLVALGMVVEGNFVRDFPRVLIVLSAFVVVYVWGALSILADGWRLVRMHKAIMASEVEAADAAWAHDTAVQTKLARRHARIATSVVAAVTVIGLAFHHLDETRQLAFYTSIQQPSSYYHAAVESVDLRGPRIVGVTMSPTATDDDLRRVLQVTPSVERLVLAGTQTNDESLKLFSGNYKLKQLDLSRTRVTSAGLLHLPSSLERLWLAHLQIDLQSAAHYADRARKSLRALDLSFCQIDDTQLAACKGFPYGLNKMSLAGNPLTDEGVASLLDKSSGIFHLDLSDTPTQGTVLEHANCPARLVLDGTKISDSQLSAMLAKPSWKCEQLSLKRTQITAAVLPALSSLGMGLELGHGLITEQDLLALSVGSFSHLALNGPEFTGEGLTTGRVAASVIDLRHSRVTDEIVAKFSVQAFPYSLNLAHTQVSQSAWVSLDIYEVLANDTQFDFAALLKQRPTSTRIIVRHEQLSPEELVKSKRTAVIFDQESFLAY